MKKRGSKSRAKSRTRVAGKRTRRKAVSKRGAGTRKRVGGASKRKNRVLTSMLGPVTAGRDIVASRRLAQAIALRLGFKPETIGDIMGQSGFDNLPKSIRKSTSVINDLKELGQIAVCDKNLTLGEGGKDRSGRWRTTTVLKSPLAGPANAAASRRLLQAMALRLGFKPRTIYKIMEEEKIKPVPTTILKNKDVKRDIGNLGTLSGKCKQLTSKQLDTSDDNPEFKDFGNTGNVVTRVFSGKKKDSNLLSEARDRGLLSK